MTSLKTLLGPLTTSWSAPPVCSYYMATCDTCTTAWQGQTCNPENKARDWTDCWPPRGSSMPDPGVLMGWGMYSPAYVCPQGFTTAALATSGGNTGWPMEYSFDQGETAVACCPTGFSPSTISVSNTLAQTCVQTVTSAAFSTVQCDQGTFKDFKAVTFPRSVNGNIQSSFILFAPLIQMNFQAKDNPPAPTTSSPKSSSTSASPGGSSGPNSSPSQTSSSISTLPGGAPTDVPNGPASLPDPSGGSSSSSGLSTGAKIGIGIGVGVGAILLGVLLLLSYRAWQRRRQTTVLAEGEAARDRMWRKPPQHPELGGQEIQELEGSGALGAMFRKFSTRKKSKKGEAPFRVASPSAARGSMPAPPAPGPFELEADSPIVGTPKIETPPHPHTPVITHTPPRALTRPVDGPAQAPRPPTPLFGLEPEHAPPSPSSTAHTGSRPRTPNIISPATPTATTRLSRETRRDEI